MEMQLISVEPWVFQMFRSLLFKLFDEVDIPPDISLSEVIEKSRYIVFVKNGWARKKLILFDVIVLTFMILGLIFLNVISGFWFDGAFTRGGIVGVSVLVFVYLFSLLRTIFYFHLIKFEVRHQLELALKNNEIGR